MATTSESTPSGNPCYVKPERKLLRVTDMGKWIKTSVGFSRFGNQAYEDYVGFLSAMNDSVKGVSSKDSCSESTSTVGILALLDELDSMIDEIPPIDQPQRFGNKAFRDWHSKLSQNAEESIKKLLPEDQKGATVELAPYLTDSFGNATRIDYGTGHEACFLIFLCCLFKLGLLKKEDSKAVVLQIFDRYIRLMRKLQSTYMMEPAGSKGVYSIDDFQFIPFYWGSAQLLGHLSLSPESFVDEKEVNEHSDENLFFAAVHHIMEVKTGPFAEHSNQLWGISGVPSWNKVNGGLLKMYKDQVCT